MVGGHAAVVVTGDVADHGLPEEYRQAAEVLKYQAPLLFCPGNHDVRAAFRTGLLDLPAADGPIDLAQEIDGVLFAMCDSTVPGRGDGYLADETLEWLDGVLSGGDGPAFVAFHHPPVDVGVPLVDVIRQTGEDRLADVLKRHPRVTALLCGHVHTGASTTFAGVPLRIAPGVSSGLLLPVDPGGTRYWDEDGGPVDRVGAP
ncbi:MAG TPA: metallophosphoesterase, partial [Amycolatopsis sp.]|nr:metallophosphoesterase [Amycolatopsis sp.]